MWILWKWGNITGQKKSNKFSTKWKWNLLKPRDSSRKKKSRKKLKTKAKDVLCELNNIEIESEIEWWRVRTFFLCLQLCLALLLVSVHAAEKKESKKAEPLEKKLDKRGLLDLGYGYGINGLDVGFLPSHSNGVYHHHSSPVYSPYYDLGNRVDVHKTITKTVGVPVPYQVNIAWCILSCSANIDLIDNQ